MAQKRTPSKRRRKLPVLNSHLEKIDLDIEQEILKDEEKVGKLKKRILKFVTSNTSLTRAEFFKYFFLPFFLTLVILSFVFFQLMQKPFRLPSYHVTTSFNSVSDIISYPVTLLSRKSALRGQEIFDPYQVKLDLDRGKMRYALIDIRSPQEYNKGHIRNARNVPTYSSFNDIKDLTLIEKEIVNKLKQQVKKGTPIVVYGHTRDSQLTRDVAAVLARNNWEVSTLGVGWNEWMHFRNLWVPEADWNTFQSEKYVEVGNQ